ncbi:MAG: bifunctional oligoribonuclease/PAP phosphatase NrnA [Bacteroidota bacterium]
MENITALKTLLATPQRIVLTSHRNPDGDAIGSSLAMQHYLRKLGHTVHVAVPSDYPDSLDWMPNVREVLVYDAAPEQVKEVIQKADIVFSLDYNDLERIDKMGEWVKARQESLQLVMIDHHLEPKAYAQFMLSESSASSTCELVYEFIVDYLNDREKIDRATADAIMTGILTDTNSFRYSTSPKLLRIAADLLELGVDNYLLQDLIFNSMKVKNLHLLGYCLNQRMEILEEYNTGIITLTKDDYEYFDISRGDTEGIVNYLLKIRHVRMAAFIMEQPTIVKISLRSKGDFSVQQIAQKHFRGGGHKNASGGASFQNLRSTVRRFKELLPQYQAELTAE